MVFEERTLATAGTLAPGAGVETRLEVLCLRKIKLLHADFMMKF